MKMLQRRILQGSRWRFKLGMLRFIFICSEKIGEAKLRRLSIQVTEFAFYRSHEANYTTENWSNTSVMVHWIKDGSNSVHLLWLLDQTHRPSIMPVWTFACCEGPWLTLLLFTKMPLIADTEVTRWAVNGPNLGPMREHSGSQSMSLRTAFTGWQVQSGVWHNTTWIEYDHWV